MKKVLMVGLVLAMLAASLASVLAHLFDMRSPKDPFAGVPNPVIGSRKYENFAGRDIRDIDLSEEADLLHTVTFDTSTRWPDESLMPRGISVEKLLEESKYLGLGLDRLHESGLTGSGVSVAIINYPILTGHEEWSDNITYIQISAGDVGMSPRNPMGAACAAVLSGKNGVAPGSHLYYFAVPEDNLPYIRLKEAMDVLLDIQSGLPDEEKIRVVSVPYGIDHGALSENLGGARDWAYAIQTASLLGITVVYPGMGDLRFTGAGVTPGKDRDDPSNYDVWSRTGAEEEIVERLIRAGVDSWDSARRELVRLLTADPFLDTLLAETIDRFIYAVAYYKEEVLYADWVEYMSSGQRDSVAVPVDYLALAGVESASAYTYYGSGDLSLAASYLAGVLALGFQAKPGASPAELYEAIDDTAFVRAGMKLINPAGFTEALGQSKTLSPEDEPSAR